MKYLQGIEHLHTLFNATTVAFDCETTGLQPVYGGLRLLQLAALDRMPVVIDCWDLEDHHWQDLEEFFSLKRYWLAHNAVFDLGWLQEHELYPEGEVLCTMLASRILTNGLPNLKHGLQHVVKRYLKLEISKEEQRSDWTGDLTHSQLDYAAYDVELLTQLDGPINQRMAEGNLHKAWFLECKALPTMAQLWRTGMPFERLALEELSRELTEDHKKLREAFIYNLDEALPLEKKLARENEEVHEETRKRTYYSPFRDFKRLEWLRDKVTEMGHDDEDYERWYAEISALEEAPDLVKTVSVPTGEINTRPKAEGSKRAGTYRPAGFNLNSPKQLLDVFTTLIGAVPVDNTGKPSASRAALREYVGDHRVVAEYLAWKRVEKRRQMVEALLKHLGSTGFIKASYMQLGADTGRMSCIGPNLQQIPRDSRFRACVKAPAGWKLVVADYAQMELRLAAAEAEDPLMIRAFQDGLDLHTVTAMQIYGVSEDEVTKEMRQISKSANFGLLYGSGARGLRNYAAGMGVQMDLAEAGEIRAKFHAVYTGISRWQRENAAQANRHRSDAAIRIRNSGLRRILPGDYNSLTVRSNTPIQGAGAAVLKRTLGKLWPLLKADGEEVVRIAGVVHDEVILLVREEHADVWCHQLAAVMQDAEAEWLGPVPPLAEAKAADSWVDAK
jgi:DNA polymerase I-like protein with 3'-5' exonuclease and polymerase domains